MADPFRVTAATVRIAASTTSANAALTGHQGQVIAHNMTTVWGYFVSGIGAPTATNTDYPLAPNSSQSISIPTNHTHGAVILDSSTGTIGITPGVGQ